MRKGRIAALVLLISVQAIPWRPSVAGNAVDLQVVSSRPSAVSGGDALVRLTPPKELGWRAQLNGRDVTPAFRPSNQSAGLVALLTDLKTGKNNLEIVVGKESKARLLLVNHPVAGPVFSGPHQSPFICETEASGLGAATDTDCSARTIIQYYYKTNEPFRVDAGAPPPPPGLWPGFKAYDPEAPPRATDVAQVVTTDGHRVPYIVRREVGTINRAIYDIQFLYQPGKPLPSPWSNDVLGWNESLVYFFGGGLGPGYHQGVLGRYVGPLEEPYLAQGYAFATSTLNAFGNTSNDKLSAETLSMVKEHFTKRYGRPRFTIGWGESGGAMAANLIAQNYPGLLDGIISFLPFPDMISTTQSISDCDLLNRAFRTSRLTWTAAQKAAVSGFAAFETCRGWGADADDRLRTAPTSIDANAPCASVVPKNLLYDATARPHGARCDLYASVANYLGRDARTGFERRPLDNVGVQYGLIAFNNGKISGEQFVELNAIIGGHDVDGHIVSARTDADVATVRLAYQRGLIATGRGALTQIPIIDWLPYLDDIANDHDRLRSMIIRQRLLDGGGDGGNQVFITYPRLTDYDLGIALKVQIYNNVYLVRVEGLVRDMDRWLGNISADEGAETRSVKIAKDKPSDLSDGCWTLDGEHFNEPASYGKDGQCNGLYPLHADPRIAAGGPLADDVLKCVLKPVNPQDYTHPLTDEQIQRLKVVFPDGVCNYARPGVGQASNVATWQIF